MLFSRRKKEDLLVILHKISDRKDPSSHVYIHVYWYVHTSMLNLCQISSLMAAAEGPAAEISSFANLKKSNLWMSFPKTGNQMGSFGRIRKNSFFHFCRPILDIFGFTLLKHFSHLHL